MVENQYIKKGGNMKLNFNKQKPNTKTVQFRIDPETSQKLTALRSHYEVTTGVILKEMIKQSYDSINMKGGDNEGRHR